MTINIDSWNPPYPSIGGIASCLQMPPQKKRALIIGITGQDGSYLAELLLEKGYDVFGTLRRSSSFNTARIDHIFDQLNLVYADLTDTGSVEKTVRDIYPNEIYNLGAQSHVRTSIDIPEYTANVDAMGTLRLLEAVKKYDLSNRTKIYQASSSEMFGSSPAPQNELTPFHPRSPYGVSKVFGYWAAVNYRESYGMHVSNGILFNHESPRRGETFVTRKIVKAAYRIKKSLQKELLLGNLDAKRDWGYAPDFVEAMYLMLQQPIPDDYVIATGETHTVREFCQEVFGQLGMDYKDFVRYDQRYTRPAEVDILLGDAMKARDTLNWKPKVKFHDLIKIMMRAEEECTKASL